MVALLLDAGWDGRWATDALTANDPAAPHLLTFEAANIIRRHELAALITADQAAQPHADRLDLAVGQWPDYLLAPTVGNFATA